MRNWSQADLARHSKVSPPQITRIMSGERNVGNDALLGIAKALKLSPTFVFRMAGILPPDSEADEKNKLIEDVEQLMNGLPPEEQENVAEYIRMRRRIFEEKARYDGKNKRKPQSAGT